MPNKSATATATYNAICNAGNGQSGNSSTTITVTIKKQCAITSQYASGITLSDGSLDPGSGSDPTAVANVKSMIQQSTKYVNTPIMGWGLPDPWPDPTTPNPTDWSALDARVQLAVDTGKTPIITLAIAPWWMKGAYNGHGQTQTLTANDEWQPIAYSSRILDNKMDKWTHLVQAVAERYMQPPYNVRTFQVWNELKGYFDSDINNYDFTTDPGQPNGANAKNGYTYMYNQVYNTLLNTASAQHIATQDIKVGGPYVFTDIWSNARQSDPSKVTTPYGIFDQRPLDVLQYWLQHKTGAGFIIFDASLENRDTMKVLNQNPFAAASLFADMVKWIRALDPKLYPGSTTLPINLSEWFSWTEIDGTSVDEDNALKASTMMQFIQAGGGTALSWDNAGNGGSDYGLWTSTLKPGGGQAYPWYNTYKSLMDNFGAGTTIYITSVSNPAAVTALASNRQLMLVNTTANPINVSVNGTTIPLTPYQVIITH
ncbi:hypothetical protein KDI_37080 [Dictyobacter arantiisoli]|uniref:D-apionate lactonase C-terminal domain-containing protein n=1 Tax=Dictyobacter arantiisoli TaxID=2014874 RepID=A0A5A5TGR4_9CHLR|nr:hypothetical protein KDI_37080 [Dictyobacter arantiisoli]